MIDIHSHILPGLDDGSKDYKESIEMARQYVESGFSQVIVTPHYDKGRYLVEPKDILSGLLSLQKAIDEEEIELKLYPGHEIQIEGDSLEKIKSGQVLNLANSRYILLEFPFFNEPLFAEDLIYKIQLEGYLPILAHCERYDYLAKDLDKVISLVKKGVYIQINFTSLMHGEGSSSYRAAKELLERDMVHFIATDAHSSENRSPDIKKARERIVDIIGREKFTTLTEDNPKKILQNDFIPINREIEDRDYEKVKREKRNLFSIFRRKR